MLENPNSEKPPRTIGTLGETSLHAALKQWYAQPGDQTEQKIDGYYIDLVRGDLLVEFQTRQFSAIRAKLANLLDHHPVRLVYPLPREKWVVRQSADGAVLSRRRSPIRGSVFDVFRELIRIPHLLGHPNFSLEVLLVQVEDILQNDQKGSWRRKGWSIVDRRLLGVIDQAHFSSQADFIALLPGDLAESFTNADLAKTQHCRRDLAQKATYTLLRAGLLTRAGKKGNFVLYQRRSPH